MHGTLCLAMKKHKDYSFISFQSFEFRSSKKKRKKHLIIEKGLGLGLGFGFGVGGICSFGLSMPFWDKYLETKTRILWHSPFYYETKWERERENSNVVGMFVFVI